MVKFNYSLDTDPTLYTKLIPLTSDEITLYKSKYLQIWLNPAWNVIIMIEIYHGITFRFGRLVINLFGDRGLLYH